MNFLRKILLGVIVAVFAGNAEGIDSSVFDLPVNTPGLQKNRGNTSKMQKKTICGQEKDCVHVVIPGSDAYKTVSSKKISGKKIRAYKLKSAIKEAQLDGGNIYFPADGTQPTTEEAVEYSCANVDNNEDSPITKWYMQMFGVIKLLNGRYMQAGWSDGDESRAYQIISIDASVAFQTRERFEKDFRKIASNPIGRILLYRILLEIRRANSSGKRTVETGISQNPTWEGHLTIMENDEYGISDDWKFVKIPKDHKFIPAVNLICEGSRSKKLLIPTLEGKYAVGNVFRGYDVGLFHELLHLYYHLRHPRREVLESNAGGETLDTGYYLWRLHFGDEGGNLSRSWLNEWGKIDFCEVRVILGGIGSCDLSGEYLNGDDLSENLYRFFSGNGGLRFTHTVFKYEEEEEEDVDIFRNKEENVLAESVVNLYNRLRGVGGESLKMFGWRELEENKGVAVYD